MQNPKCVLNAIAILTHYFWVSRCKENDDDGDVTNWFIPLDVLACCLLPVTDSIWFYIYWV